jgi:hypothetical protein
MEHWLGFVPYVLFVGGAFSLAFAALERRSQARRRRLTTEPSRVCRRPFGLSYAAMADCSSMA